MKRRWQKDLTEADEDRRKNVRGRRKKQQQDHRSKNGRENFWARESRNAAEEEGESFIGLGPNGLSRRMQVAKTKDSIGPSISNHLGLVARDAAAVR